MKTAQFGGQLAVVRAGLVASLDSVLVDEMLQAYVDAKQNFYAGGLRLSEVEGGRFCEAAFRLLESIALTKRTPLGQQLDSGRLINQLANVAAGTHPDSVRLHIPRALRVVYDIRNNRDAAHLADGIDPNQQDASLVANVLDWVLAEFVRLYHAVSADEAQRIVSSLVTRRAPAVQAFGDFLKVLKPSLSAGDFALLLLYQRAEEGATYKELSCWSKPSMQNNLKRTLDRLEHDTAFIHCDGARYFITQAGEKEVEKRQLVAPEE
ncbi:MAG: hypothetical protein ACJ796_00790 [Gemmatimonadaceae bacterium]